MKNTKKFTIDTPIIEQYGSRKGKLIGYARVTGIGYYYERNHADCKEDDDNDSLFDCDIECVSATTNAMQMCFKDVTEAYKISSELGDTFAEICNKAALAHVAKMYESDVAKYWDNATDESAQKDYERDAMEYLRYENDMRNGDGC